jgi:hypothetical protein
VLSLENFEIEIFVLDFVLPKILGRNRRAASNDEDNERRRDHGGSQGGGAHAGFLDKDSVILLVWCNLRAVPSSGAACHH